MQEVDALLILNAMSGIGNRTTIKLLDRFGTAQEVLSLSKEALQESGLIQAKYLDQFLSFSRDKFLKTEYDLVTKHNVCIVSFFDDLYPQALREIPDAPIILYVKGRWPMRLEQSVAIVGSRRCTMYGMSLAQKFSQTLTREGVLIISGMARGIDTAAHQGALKEGSTVAVLGSGLCNVYPQENRKLFSEIAECGAVISEFPMTMEPLPYNFPRRNRLVSGMSTGVLVIEAAQKSGALITADFALEQGKNVYAVPGSVDNIFSNGTHELIKQGAKLVTGVEDVLEDFELGSRLGVQAFSRLEDAKGLGRQDVKASGRQANEMVNNVEEKNLTDKEKLLFDLLADDPKHIDLLVDDSLTRFEIMNCLFTLEMKGLIKQLPGKYFTKA